MTTDARSDRSDASTLGTDGRTDGNGRKRPRLLDLFCGAGGSSVGYARAGFDVEGVDIRPQPHYPFTFHQRDALDYLRACLVDDESGMETFPYDVIAASPPCQPYSRTKHLMTAQRKVSKHLELVEPTRALLVESGVPWIMENVVGAPVEGVFLCGSSFGLRVRRHRLFESSHLLLGSPCQHRVQGKPVGVYHVMGDTVKGRDNSRPWRGVATGGSTAESVEDAQDAMQIDWMPRWSELKDAIPPAYTEHLGAQIRRALDV